MSNATCQVGGIQAGRGRAADAAKCGRQRSRAAATTATTAMETERDHLEPSASQASPWLRSARSSRLRLAVRRRLVRRWLQARFKLTKADVFAHGCRKGPHRDRRAWVQIRLLTAATPVSNAERPTAGAGLQAIRAWHAPRAQPKLSARASFNFRPFGPQKDRFDQASSDQASSFLVPGPRYTAGRAIEAHSQNHRSRTRLWQHSLYTAQRALSSLETLDPEVTSQHSHKAGAGGDFDRRNMDR
ncbi:hypothetical protein PaG_01522 [Moesziomyces aphidis]|uniref:Uncharacterized protein n=1 Tax=Moesziomyces aphidis TaxID=84754 RepID=W3VR36_MOEAP|nr:hypothetical protein PaG_01522 [Moesziomyces aphidis]